MDGHKPEIFLEDVVFNMPIYTQFSYVPGWESLLTTGLNQPLAALLPKNIAHVLTVAG
jgi:hypothetical protein